MIELVKSVDIEWYDAFAVGLLLLNVAAFVVYGLDKWKARHKRWRVPERVLLGMAALGGSVGALLGMWLWHHKTQHRRFALGVPLMLAVQLVLAVWVASRCGLMR